ncbi:hypothetical protein K505DRAFT_421335 [Melanomma pulvis-pyrius CBS 109.77]|uniref:Uncharacterized protein n=1 Tax=Melanomma pulvis-pyrius CBS 109.77 TaxID=1314802 RepID=A0A6A6WW23_9PLEO|nr:hypothetical protein K505DRAFT_421335 [Melanomma pulvis-pyrius CBS 109.77]
MAFHQDRKEKNNFSTTAATQPIVAHQTCRCVPARHSHRDAKHIVVCAATVVALSCALQVAGAPLSLFPALGPPPPRRDSPALHSPPGHPSIHPSIYLSIYPFSQPCPRLQDYAQAPLRAGALPSQPGLFEPSRHYQAPPGRRRKAEGRCAAGPRGLPANANACMVNTKSTTL